MKRTRVELSTKEYRFVILRFEREDGDPVINDGIVQAAAKEENLRPVSREEFGIFCRKVLALGSRLVVFGNIAHGPADSGSFPGVPFLNTEWEMGVAQNWVRGNTGDQWGDDDVFLFIPIAPAA
ncbi:hypothetical protein A2V54_00245 [candidate division WWE3 bacterium RBG_19FT_COMBO_53_11]|uniref:Uncharacterized protein n=1 Tax=candidate division WWE3 bacterium RBG_19FT_COMBO_53_11 TaxID=1802613 RepID=A0A1F4UHP5_UNCKA|nr:MAG: hypothetical protein A2155_00990 [candidate division WWE3 bacterium RBG_16_52_45]OGC44437.1 MAG: hypothetical protein A2V54_00245 [candidate division WWE3 bacterium RBG_19FT_COMBO_53_11]